MVVPHNEPAAGERKEERGRERKREREGGRSSLVGGFPPDPVGGWLSSGSGGTKFPFLYPTLLDNKNARYCTHTVIEGQST